MPSVGFERAGSRPSAHAILEAFGIRTALRRDVTNQYGLRGGLFGSDHLRGRIGRAAQNDESRADRLRQPVPHAVVRDRFESLVH